MKVTYIHHSCFLVETSGYYYLFDYEKGNLPAMNREKPIYVLASHSHADHYTLKVFSLLEQLGMQDVRGVLSADISLPDGVQALQVAPEQVYTLGEQHSLITLRSTDLGVAFLIEEAGQLLYHAGDLNDWVWDTESPAYNAQMTKDYREQIGQLADYLGNRTLDLAFVVLDPRQEQDYDRGLVYFLEHIRVSRVYPMHYWGEPRVITQFLKDHPTYQAVIGQTE
ncbi:MAG: MBL fold metallo-hydrolase [Oscillospiraceae bacterium]|nr:MBL fold metallo-hydrolase [Oscillospiraceae bacterium]